MLCLYGHYLRREDDHVLRTASQFEVKGRKVGPVGSEVMSCYACMVIT